MTSSSFATETADLLARLGVVESAFTGGSLVVTSPITGERIAEVRETDETDCDAAIAAAETAFRTWRLVPAPKRGELIRLFGLELRTAKTDLGRLVTIEAGKIVSEGLGEVQEMIDICDFAVGLSRQLYGLTVATERPSHRMMETWHPAWGHRRHLGLQLSCRRLVVERCHRAGLRRHRRLETVGKDPTHRAGHAGAVREGCGQGRSAGWPLCCDHRR